MLPVSLPWSVLSSLRSLRALNPMPVAGGVAAGGLSPSALGRPGAMSEHATQSPTRVIQRHLTSQTSSSKKVEKPENSSLVLWRPSALPERQR
jgi:hypothetical protein